jgi:hypothetical protein
VHRSFDPLLHIHFGHDIFEVEMEIGIGAFLKPPVAFAPFAPFLLLVLICLPFLSPILFRFWWTSNGVDVHNIAFARSSLNTKSHLLLQNTSYIVRIGV